MPGSRFHFAGRHSEAAAISFRQRQLYASFSPHSHFFAIDIFAIDTSIITPLAIYYFH